MIIKKIKIKNFKGISLLEYNPKKINLIVGKNNTGKTSFLEAINLIFNLNEIKQIYPENLSSIIKSGIDYSELSAITDKRTLKLKIKKADEIETVDEFKKSLIDGLIKSIRIKDNIEISKDLKNELGNQLTGLMDPELKTLLLKESIVVVKDEKETNVYYQIYRMSIQGLLSKLESILDNLLKELEKKVNIKIKDFEVRLNLRNLLFELSSLMVKRPASDKKEVFLINDLVREIKRVALSEENPEIIQRMQEVEQIIKEHTLIENLQRLAFNYVTFNNGNGKKSLIVPFSFLGDGFKALVGLLWYISSKDVSDKILLLDEPEVHMHPGYIQDLIKIIIKFSKQFNIQFFIVTHNGDFIDLIFDETLSTEEREYMEKEASLLRMQKTKNYTTSEYLDYKEAKHTKEELLLDLRGI